MHIFSALSYEYQTRFLPPFISFDFFLTTKESNRSPAGAAMEHRLRFTRIIAGPSTHDHCSPVRISTLFNTPHILHEWSLDSQLAHGLNHTDPLRE